MYNKKQKLSKYKITVFFLTSQMKSFSLNLMTITSFIHFAELDTNGNCGNYSSNPFGMRRNDAIMSFSRFYLYFLQYRLYSKTVKFSNYNVSNCIVFGLQRDLRAFPSFYDSWRHVGGRKRRSPSPSSLGSTSAATGQCRAFCAIRSSIGSDLGLSKPIGKCLSWEHLPYERHKSDEYSSSTSHASSFVTNGPFSSPLCGALYRPL